MDDPDNQEVLNPELAAALKDAALEVRQGFVKKVYSILMVQLIATFGFVALVKGVPSINYGVQETWYLAIPCSVF